MTRALPLLACLLLAGCGVPMTAGLIGAGLGLATAAIGLDEKLIDAYLAAKGKPAPVGRCALDGGSS